MLKGNWNVFKGPVQSGSDPILTSSDLNTRLAQFEQLAIHCVVESVSGTGGAGFKLQLFHSGDGRHWKAKAAKAEIGGTSGETLVAGQSHQFYGYDAGEIPSLANVQIRVSMPPNTSAQVSIHVTARER